MMEEADRRPKWQLLIPQQKTSPGTNLKKTRRVKFPPPLDPAWDNLQHASHLYIISRYIYHNRLPYSYDP